MNGKAAKASKRTHKMRKNVSTHEKGMIIDTYNHLEIVERFALVFPRFIKALLEAFGLICVEIHSCGCATLVF